MRNFSGVIFHYFHNDLHKKCQGSLSAEGFDRMLDDIIKRFDVITPYDFVEKKRKNNLNGTEIVLTFDGGLKSQFDIAYPILKKRGLKAFWFPYTCVFEKKPAMIELCHDFRFSCYSNVNDFYDDFFSSVINNYISLDEYHYYKKAVEEFGYYNWGNFYTFEDKMFKYFRDEVLKQELFDSVIRLMMGKKGYRVENAIEKLWVSNKDVAELIDNENIIGVHSHNHPYKLEKLSQQEQYEEYKQARDTYEKTFGSQPLFMSHPANSFNKTTIDVLKQLGFEFGFCSSNRIDESSMLTLERIDHSSYLNEYGKNGEFNGR